MSILNIKEKLAQRIQNAATEEKTDSMPNQKPKEQAELEYFKEIDVGISKYMSDLPGFEGVIKHRYSDFCVHEIDKEGNVIVLDNFDLPDERPPKTTEDFNLISKEIIGNLEKLIEGNDNDVEPVDIDVTDLAKDNRTLIHQFIKDKYGSGLIANTIDKNERKFISVSKQKKDNKDSRWPGHLPNYLHFTLFKANIDTGYVFNLIARKLRMKVDHFFITGTKDKRAYTTQRVSVKNLKAHKLKNLGLRNIGIGNFEYKDYSLSLGRLYGNNFEIALREITAPDDEIKKAMTALMNCGFINYYGMQRFGRSFESPTHQIGKLLIKEKYGEALELILKPLPNQDEPDIRSAKAIYAKTKNAHEALGAIRNKRSIEGQLLYGLKKNGPNAYVNAFDLLPRNTRLLYSHAYQSYIWNEVVSRRLEKFGKAVLNGDLVQIEKDDLAEDTVDGELIEKEAKEEVTPEEDDSREKPCPVRHITEEEVSKYTIYDVMMPLPGNSALYPNNALRDIYAEVLANDGLTLDSFISRTRKYQLSAVYRKIVKLPKNLTWKIVKYVNPNDDLILSDLDKLAGRTLDEEEGDLRALIIKMDLHKSTYATMALREILRTETSSSYQANLGMKRQLEADNNALATKRKKIDEDGMIHKNGALMKVANKDESIEELSMETSVS